MVKMSTPAAIRLDARVQIDAAAGDHAGTPPIVGEGQQVQLHEFDEAVRLRIVMHTNVVNKNWVSQIGTPRPVWLWVRLKTIRGLPRPSL